MSITPFHYWRYIYKKPIYCFIKVFARNERKASSFQRRVHTKGSLANARVTSKRVLSRTRCARSTCDPIDEGLSLLASLFVRDRWCEAAMRTRIVEWPLDKGWNPFPRSSRGVKDSFPRFTRAFNNCAVAQPKSYALSIARYIAIVNAIASVSTMSICYIVQEANVKYTWVSAALHFMRRPVIGGKNFIRVRWACNFVKWHRHLNENSAPVLTHLAALLTFSRT